MMEVAGPQEVHRVHSRSARRPDASGSHSRSISDPTRSSWFLPSLLFWHIIELGKSQFNCKPDK